MAEVIDSIKHPAVAASRESLRGSSEESARCFLIDGPKLLREGIEAGAPIERVFFQDPVEPAEADLERAAAGAGLEHWRVTRGVFFRLLGLGYETSVRVLAIVEIRRRSVDELLSDVGPESWVLVGEKIQDPRNVGVLIRTADAWGLGAAAFTEGTAEAFSRGSVRSSTGSILRVQVTEEANVTELLGGLRERGLRIVGASAGAEKACWEVDLRPPCAVVVGNEASGLSEEARGLCDVVARIPMYGGAHSFNVTVAAGILLYEARRQREVGRQD